MDFGKAQEIHTLIQTLHRRDYCMLALHLHPYKSIETYQRP